MAVWIELFFAQVGFWFSFCGDRNGSHLFKTADDLAWPLHMNDTAQESNSYASLFDDQGPRQALAKGEKGNARRVLKGGKRPNREV